MEKELIRLTSVFLKMNRFILFLLIVFPITLTIYSTSSEDYKIINDLLSSIGGICLLGWLFAVGHKANKKLLLQGIGLKSFKFFNTGIIMVVASYLLVITSGTKTHEITGIINIHYSTPIYLTIVFLISFLTVVLITAKALVSAELNKDVYIGNYLITFLLMIVAPVGIWFVQPRVQNI
jgi:hypothetical protein